MSLFKTGRTVVFCTTSDSYHKELELGILKDTGEGSGGWKQGESPVQIFEFLHIQRPALQKEPMNISVNSMSSWPSNSTEVPYMKFDMVSKTHIEVNGMRISPKMAKALRSTQTDCKGI